MPELAAVEDLTITQATARLKNRGVDVARRTVASWVEQGLLKARLIETPTGKYWVMSAHVVDTFDPPKMGRPSKKGGKKGGKK